MIERWAPAPGLEGRFEVSDQNRIRPVAPPLPTQTVGGQVLVTIDGALHSVDALSAVAFAEPVVEEEESPEPSKGKGKSAAKAEPPKAEPASASKKKG